MIQPGLRYLFPGDMPEVLDIERLSSRHPLSEEDAVKILNRRNCLGMVAHLDGLVIGFSIFGLSTKTLSIVRLAVDPGFRRKGVGTAMVARLKAKLLGKRDTLRVAVGEENLGAHLFLKACGLRAVEVNRGICPDGGDAYSFTWSIPRKAEVSRS